MAYRRLPKQAQRGGQLGAAVAVIALIWSGSASSAFAFGSALPCTDRNISAAFSSWNDPSPYFPVANGGFEAGSSEWQLSDDASVVTGNEPYQVGGPGDSHSLALAPGASAESRTACVAIGEPTVRLFVHTPRVLGAILVIDASVRNPATGVSLSTRYLVVGGRTPAGWAPTLPIVIPSFGGVLSAELTLRFTARGTPARWAVDDVYVDPFRSY